MLIKPIIKEALQSLNGTRQRSILALLGIVIGIASVIAMVSVGAIVREESLRKFLELGPEILSISKQYSQKQRGPKQDISMADALNITKYCSNIEKVAPYTSTYARIQYNGKELWAQTLGVTYDFFSLNKLSLEKGRLFNRVDGDLCYCILGHGAAQKLYLLGAKDLIGSSFFINNKKFTVIGSLKEVDMGSMRPYPINDGIMIPFSTVKRISENTSIEEIVAKMKTKEDYKDASLQVKEYFKKVKRNLKVQVKSAEAIIRNMKEQSKIFTLFLGTIGSISLIVGGIGVMNMMLVSVTERKKEIGIRRAMGAREKDIQVQFLIEAVLLCFIGGLLGIFIGIGISYIIANFNNWQFIVAYDAVFFGAGVSGAVGIFFGFYPARQAARFDPIVALRTE